MPLSSIHLIADRELFRHAKIENKEDFRFGSIFPDALWTVTDISKTLMCDENVHKKLHYYVDMEGWNKPNFYKFYSEYREKFVSSDFLKGYIFHLLLDNENNKAWDRLTEKHDDGTFSIVYGDGKVYECKDLDELCRCKYGDACRFGLSQEIDAINKNNITLKASTECKQMFNITNDEISHALKVLEDSLTFKRDVPDEFRLGNEIYEDIINRSIEGYVELSRFERWEQV